MDHDLEADRLANAIAGVGIASVFQPVVDLQTLVTVGYEALARWPASGLRPDDVFAAAREQGATSALDRRCRQSALSSATRADLGSDVLLFVNVEPASADAVVDIAPHRGQTAPPLQVVVEFTERDLLVHPAALFGQVAAVRAQGHRIALDDVGAHPDSLALIDLLMPDVIKLDAQLLQAAPARDRARTLAAVMAHSERTGALLLAEGIETAEHLERARAVGATLGQGWLFGRPAPLPPVGARRHQPLRLASVDAPIPRTPADLSTAPPGRRTRSCSSRSHVTSRPSPLITRTPPSSWPRSSRRTTSQRGRD